MANRSADRRPPRDNLALPELQYRTAPTFLVADCSARGPTPDYPPNTGSTSTITEKSAAQLQQQLSRAFLGKTSQHSLFFYCFPSSVFLSSPLLSLLPLSLLNHSRNHGHLSQTGSFGSPLLPSYCQPGRAVRCLQWIALLLDRQGQGMFCLVCPLRCRLLIAIESPVPQGYLRRQAPCRDREDQEAPDVCKFCRHLDVPDTQSLITVDV